MHALTHRVLSKRLRQAAAGLPEPALRQLFATLGANSLALLDEALQARHFDQHARLRGTLAAPARRCGWRCRRACSCRRRAAEACKGAAPAPSGQRTPAPRPTASGRSTRARRCAVGARLPAIEAGSPIMPDGVNPKQVEALTLVCAQVLGHEVAVDIGASPGRFDLCAAMLGPR